MSSPVNLLVITDATIRAMFDDPRFLTTVPCLASVAQGFATRKKDCTRCQAKMANLVRTTMLAARQCLTSLPSASRVALKQLLNAKQVRVIKRNSKGQSITVTF